MIPIFQSDLTAYGRGFSAVLQRALGGRGVFPDDFFAFWSSHERELGFVHSPRGMYGLGGFDKVDFREGMRTMCPFIYFLMATSGCATDSRV